MSNIKIKKPFFIFNPKSYLYGEKLLELAIIADNLGKEYNDKISIFVTAPFTDLKNLADKTSHIIVTSQHMDGIDLGRGMGHITAEFIHNSGARATFLNHAEKQLSLEALLKSINRAKELDIHTIVCADSLEEAQTIAHLKPSIILCEPNDLIGTGQTSDISYIEKTNKAIRDIDNKILIMQAAGISDASDVFRTISLGADGTGCTSGIVKASDPKDMLINMVKACIDGYERR